ncbi:ParB/RepB/Spo0J family partition protein [Streptomyces sp. NPDC046371]|uniref:ParB/RepB/Spo0J family partition protein n=1 Tax=Streptomyces sp. NPDC046371 TaxID=3154916 RepID=UPI0033E4D0ED
MTSKADSLGPSAAFGAAASARSSRRDAFNRSLGIEDNPDAVTHLPVDDISLNPDNPRSKLGNLTELAGSLRDHGQKAAVSVMGRTAYLAANPERGDALEPKTRYVVIDGNSRLAAAREAGLKTIKVMVDDELGADPNGLLESALVANVHRKDLDPLDEARVLEQLLGVHGSQEALAARLHRSQGWVSQRLGLLTLTPELTERLVKGEESASNLRAVGRKPAEEQEAALDRLKAEQEAAKKARRAARAQTLSKPSPTPGAKAADKAVTTDPPALAPEAHSPGPSVDPAAEPAVVEPGLRPGGTPHEEVPAPRTEDGTAPSDQAPAESPQPGYTMYRNLPWQDGNALAELVLQRMEPAQQAVLLKRLLATRRPETSV